MPNGSPAKKVVPDMISTTLEDGVQTLRFNRPEKKNAITGAMYTALAEGLETGNTDKNVRCNLIAGTPGAFTAGNDIGDFLKFAAATGLDGTPVIRFLKALALCEKPIVAAVDGLAIGVGTTLLLHCDMAFASQKSMFKSPFVDLGLVPEAGSSLLGPSTMGHVKAFELLCLGRSFDAKQALAAGLINEIVEENQVEDVALACAREIAAKPPAAMQLSRNLLKGNRDTLIARIDKEAQLFTERLASDEAKAAFMAFMTKSAGR